MSSLTISPISPSSSTESKPAVEYPSYETLDAAAAQTQWRQSRNRMWERYMAACKGSHSLDALKRFLHEYCRRLRGSAKTTSKVVSMIKMEAAVHGQAWLNAAELCDLAGFIRQLRLRDDQPSQTKQGLRYASILTIIGTLEPRVDYDLQAIVLLLVYYDGLFRTGEILRDRRTDRHLERGDCTRDPVTGDLTIRIGNTKTDYGSSSTGPACPGVDLVVGEMASRPTPAADARLLRPAQRPLAPHSQGAGRPGGVGPSASVGTLASSRRRFANKVPYPHIKQRGRWKSDTALRYFDEADEVDRSTAKAASRIFKAFLESGGESTSCTRGRG